MQQLTIQNLSHLERLEMLRQAVIKDMPTFSKYDAKIPHHQFNAPLPKIWLEEAEIQHEKFLNKHLHLIEDMHYKNQLPDDFLYWFGQQNRRYRKDIFKGDHLIQKIRNISMKLFLAHQSNLLACGFIMSNQRIVYSRTLGAELETYLSSDTDDEIGTTQLLAFNMSSAAVVGTWYNQIAVKRGSSGASGNIHIALYDDTGSTVPNVLLGETGNIAMPAATSYTYQNLSNGGAAATTTTLWAAACNSASGNKIARNFSLSASAKLKGDLSFTYGTPPSPWTGAYSETTNQFRFKMRGN